MAVATFDTLKFANAIKAAGVPQEQAEAQAHAFAEVVQANFQELVTKDDLERVAKELRGEIDRIFKVLETKANKSDLEQLAKDLRRELAETAERLDRKNAETAVRLERKIEETAKELDRKIEEAAERFDRKIEETAERFERKLAETAKELDRKIENTGERLDRKIAEEVQKLNARIDTFQAKHTGDTALVKWMLGFIVTGVVGILIRLFFFRAV